MTGLPRSATPDATVEEATRMMFLNGFRRLPVIGRGPPGAARAWQSLRDLFTTRISRPPQQRSAAS